MNSSAVDEFMVYEQFEAYNLFCILQSILIVLAFIYTFWLVSFLFS